MKYSLRKEYQLLQDRHHESLKCMAERGQLLIRCLDALDVVGEQALKNNMIVSALGISSLIADIQAALHDKGAA